MAKLNKKIYELNEEDIRNYIPGASPFFDSEYYLFKDNKLKKATEDKAFMDLCKELISVDEFYSEVSLKHWITDDKFKHFVTKPDLDFSYGKNLIDRILELSNVLKENGFEKDMKEYHKELMKYLHHYGREYKGCFKRLNEMLECLCEKNQDMSSMDAFLMNPKNWDKMQLEERFRKNKDVLCEYNNLQNYFSLEAQDRIIAFWEYIAIMVQKEMWSKYKQTYVLNKNLALDFANQPKLDFPANILDYLPLNVFYFDLSNIKDICEFDTGLKLSIEGAFVRVIKMGDDYALSVKFHWKGEGRGDNFISDGAFFMERDKEISFNRQFDYKSNPNRDKKVKAIVKALEENNVKDFNSLMIDYTDSDYHFCDNIMASMFDISAIINFAIKDFAKEKMNMSFFENFSTYVKENSVLESKIKYQKDNVDPSKNMVSFDSECNTLRVYYMKEVERFMKHLKLSQKVNPSMFEGFAKKIDDYAVSYLWQVETYTRIVIHNIFYLCSKYKKNSNIKNREYEYIYGDKPVNESVKVDELGSHLNYLHLSQKDYESKDGIIYKYIGSGKHRKLTKIRFTRGHQKHVWYGSERTGDRHAEIVDIDPYVSYPDGEVIESTTIITD